jgi:NADPH2:quinone reductase
MAQDFRVSTTVFPFILRGINLLGASSMNCPMPLRQTIWNQLADDMKPADLSKILTQEVPLAEVGSIFGNLLDRKLHGRVVVNCA